MLTPTERELLDRLNVQGAVAVETLSDAERRAATMLLQRRLVRRCRDEWGRVLSPASKDVLDDATLITVTAWGLDALQHPY